MHYKYGNEWPARHFVIRSLKTDKGMAKRASPAIAATTAHRKI